MAATAPDIALAAPASPSPPATAAALRRLPRTGAGRPAPTARTTVLCSILDRSYLTRFLVLHESVVRHWPGVHWQPCCMDADAKAVLDHLCLPRVTPVAVDEVEAYDPDLDSVRADRDALEYCSTVKPSLCRYALASQPERSGGRPPRRRPNVLS